MGSIGDCCCCDLSPDEVPEITSDLFNILITGGQQSNCCYDYLYGLLGDETCYSSYPTNAYDVTSVCEVDNLYSPIAIFTLVPPSTDPVGDCLPDLFVGSTTTTTVVIHKDKRLAIKVDPAQAEVTISKIMYSCGGGEPVEKIAIMVYLTYEIALRHWLSSKTTTTRSTVAVSECLKDVENVHVTGKDFDCADVAFPGPGLYGFRRIRFFDTMPTGDVSFVDSDIFPEGCELEFCEVDLNAYDWSQEVCFTSSSSPIDDACQEPTLNAETFTRYCEIFVDFVAVKVQQECASGFAGYGCYSANIFPFSSMTYLPTSETMTINVLEGGCSECHLDEPQSFLPDPDDYECESGEGGCPSECYYDDTDCCCELPIGLGYTPCTTPSFFWVVDDVTDYSFSKTIAPYTPQEICFRPPTTWTITLTPRS
jgi:hypothetical protein